MANSFRAHEQRTRWSVVSVTFLFTHSLRVPGLKSQDLHRFFRLPGSFCDPPLGRLNEGQIKHFMALLCHDQPSAPFVTWKKFGGPLQSGVQLGPAARLSARKVHLIVWVHFWREF